MKITKEIFTIKISDILNLKSFIHFKISTKKNNCLYKYTATPTQIFYFLQKGTSNKCAVLYVENDSLDESLNSEKYREKFLNEKEFNDFFKTYFDKNQ
jgi:hypothetical protein